MTYSDYTFYKLTLAHENTLECEVMIRLTFRGQGKLIESKNVVEIGVNKPLNKGRNVNICREIG